MLSFWQHCYHTNRPDRVFILGLLAKNARFSHSVPKIGGTVIIHVCTNWKGLFLSDLTTFICFLTLL